MSIFETIAQAVKPQEIQDQEDILNMLNKMEAEGFKPGDEIDQTFGYSFDDLGIVVLAERTGYGAKLHRVEFNHKALEPTIQSLFFVRKQFYLENNINLELLHGTTENIEKAQCVVDALETFNDGRHYNRLDIERENMSDIVKVRSEMGDVKMIFRGNELEELKIKNIVMQPEDIELFMEALGNSIT